MLRGVVVAAAMAGTAVVVVAPDVGGQSVVHCYGRAATIVGTEGDDAMLRGSDARDVIAGLGGNDTISGGDGDDFICPGDGNDATLGGAGDDVLEASAGDDALDGGPGRYDAVGFYGAPAPVTADLLSGRATGWGSDSLQGFEGIVGSPRADSLRGDGNQNFLEGRDGNDVLAARGGQDELTGDAGNDVLAGGRGYDLAFYDFSPRPVNANLARRRATGWGSDRLLEIDALHGSRLGDRLTGNGASNLLSGHGGNDVIHGGGGADSLFGEAGRDTLDGGRSRDRVDGGVGRDSCVNGERVQRCP